MNPRDIAILDEVPGVYKIISPTGKIYIGETTSLKRRCKDYLTPNKIKKQRAIYNSLMKYGVERHVLEIIEVCDKNELLERERFWQEFYDSIESGLNCKYTRTRNKRQVHSERTISIMSEKARGENNPFFNKKHKPEALSKISEASKGKKNPNYGGKLQTPEYLGKQSLSNSKSLLIITDFETGDIYNFINSKEAAFFLQCSPSAIREAKRNGYKIKKRYGVQAK